ncbi:hypothetical protein MCY_01723 [Bartonella rattimassiliensis 15908]|uniref:Uncharacterized protein n=1 Tax=Bartonella rattimassiliensis 15908 TaxID=1094556 RepID=J0QBG7_9HYPH|nr:hypothetical protein MCY_01723 [Bartonella rattimassiliensis 15908]
MPGQAVTWLSIEVQTIHTNEFYNEYIYTKRIILQVLY